MDTLPSASVDLIVTDPPYGNHGRYGTRLRTIIGDEHPLVGLAVLSKCYRVLKPDTSAYMFCGTLHLPLLLTFFTQYTKFSIRDVLIWNKLHWGNIGYGFAKQYEAILVLEKGKPQYRQSILPNLLSVRRVRATEHPHKKPTALLETLITHSSNPGGIVLDPFAGSGTTLLAARAKNRNYIGIELDEKYYATASRNLAEARTFAERHRTPDQ